MTWQRKIVTLRVSLLVFLFLNLLYLASSSDSPEKARKTSENGKNILIYMGFSTYSMRIAIWPFIEALIEKGHHVSMVSAQEPKVRDARVDDFVPKKLQEWFSTFDDYDFMTARKTGQNPQLWYTFADYGVESCEMFYADPEAVEWLRKSKFDLVVVDSTNECGYGLAHYFNAKIMVYSTFTVAPWFYDAYGLPDSDSSWIADVVYYYPAHEPSFISRVVAAVHPIWWRYDREHSYFPRLEEVTKKGLGLDSVPSFRELEKNTTVVLVRTHYSQEYARSLPPNVISIGGVALAGEMKPLPKEFEDFIAKGKKGFVYISFGTLMDFSKLEKTRKDVFIKVLNQFPDIQFIWKAAHGVGVDLPENFLVSKWVPQRDLLAHPKIKAFVTHGGLGSTNEAVYHGVPMLAFPIMADQDFNTNFLEPKGIGIRLEITTLTEEILFEALTKIITDEKYKKNMEKVSRLYQDRPMSPVDTATWWVEFVLRHDTKEITEYLQSRSVHQSWWMRRQVDVWVFLATASAIVIIIPIYVVCRLMKMICWGAQAKKVKQQ